MASKLNPGADATLVNVAYRAAMANTPGDYSSTLEKAAESYGKTMEASAKMWKDVATVGTALGSEMVKNANERAAYAAKTNVLNPEDAKLLTDEIYAIKDAQKELGLLPGVFGDRETKKRLAELKMEQRDLFAEIDLAAASIKAGTDAVAAGTFDTKLSMDGGEMVNAIIKNGLKNNVTDNGNVAKLSRNEYGELIYTLRKEDGSLADNPNGTSDPVTMTIKQFNEAITTNVDDKGAKAAVFNTYNDSVADRGFKSKTGVYDEQMRAMDSNWLDTQLEKPVDLKRAMHMKFGYMETSFFDDITTNKNEYSADLYNTLVSVTGSKTGELTGSIVNGIEDIDNSGGISAEEVKNSENYQVLTANLLGLKDPEVSKAYFKDYVLKEFEGANNYGHGNKKTKPGSGTGTKTDTNLGIADWTYPEFGRGKVNWTSARTIKRRLLNGTGFDYDYNGDGEKERYDYINGDWYENWEDENNPGTKIGSADNMVLNVLKTNHEAFQGLETTVEGATITEEGENVEDVNTKSLHQNLFSKMDVNKDDAVSRSLNDYFVDTDGNTLSNKRSTLQFMPFTREFESVLKGSGGAGFLKPDAAGTNDIMLYNPQTGEVVKDENGDRIRFKIGDDMSNLSNGLSDDVTKLLEILKQNGIIPKSGSKQMTAEDYVNEDKNN